MSSLATAIIVALVLTGRALGALLPSSSEIKWVNCSTHVPQPLQVLFNITDWNSPDLPPLPSTLHCGRIDVPMDYAQPFSEYNNITLGLATYQPKNPKGIVFFNPGGPGVEAVSSAWQIALNLTGDVLFTGAFNGLEDFEFMMMDVRGTFSSNQLNCSVDAFNAIPIQFPTNQSAFDTFKNATTNFAQSCIDLSTPSGIVAHVGTQEVIQDLENIRIALGYETIDLLGVSYGTYTFAEYAFRYPKSMGRVVLDAVTPHGLSDLDQITDDIKAVNRLLLRADAYCIFNTTCPFHSQGKGSIPAAFGKVLQQAIQKPLIASQCINTTACSPSVTATDVRQAVTTILMGTPDYSLLFQALEQALNGDASLLAHSPATDVTQTLVLPLYCLDDNIDNNTFAGFDNIRTSIIKDDPAMVMNSLIWQAKLWCSGWPFPGRPKMRLPSNLPLLWVTADFDLNTPTEWATFNWEQAANSVLVNRHGDDHGTIQVLGSPARDIMVQFLQTGVLPQPVNETLVTVLTPGSERGPIENPYTAPIGEPAGDDFSSL